MFSFQRLCGGACAATMFVAFAPSALAQEKTTVWICQGVGASQPEPVGDKEGHSISVGQNSCYAESGPQIGGVLTGTSIWEWNGPNGVELSINGVIRKPGAAMVYQDAEGKNILTMTDGKVTGWTASGHGVNVLATGDWASMNGKPYEWTAKPTGPGQFRLEAKQDF